MRGRRLLILIAALVAIVLGGLVWLGAGAGVALLCPRCAGFVETAPGVYQQRASARQKGALDGAVAEARARTSAFFGGSKSAPDIFVCDTELCYGLLTGRGSKSKARAYGDMAMIVSPRGANTTIISHELTHTELHHRLSNWLAVPAWFDEGVAVAVARDARFLDLSDPASPRCRTRRDRDLPSTRFAWSSAAAADASIYADAACRVVTWAGGDLATRTAILIDDMNAGATFSDAYAGQPR